MARRRAAEVPLGEEHDDVIRWYRERLSEPAEFPWVGTGWEPVRIGPTWQTDRHGRWVLPDATIGWDVLGWCGTELQHGRGKPWRFTLEQARFLLWWYAVDEHGGWLSQDFVLQRLKGWGKDPLGACMLYVEAIGPSRVAYMDGEVPVATDCPEAWVQTAATSLEQTKNTMRLMPGLISPAAKTHYRVQPGKELVHAIDDTRLIQAVTSSPATLEGARATFVLKNETQHWLANNDGHEMAAVIERNATKSAEGAARSGAITNAPEPGEDSVAERDRDAYELAMAGGSMTTGILYDSLEAPPDAPLAPPRQPDEEDEQYERRTRDTIASVVKAVRGDSVWLSPGRIVKSVLDTRNPPSRSRRFWYNQIVAAEDAWIVPQEFDLCVDATKVVSPSDDVVLFFDGSKTDDATGLVGCRVDDGHVFTLGMWQRPPGHRGKGWVVPRDEVDLRVRHVFETHRVVAFWADPSHTTEDETGERFWDGLIDEWHRRWGQRLRLWAQPGKSGHAVMWDMSSPARSAEFTAAAGRCTSEIESTAKAIRGDGPPVAELFTHDGDARLVKHVRNARRAPNRWGVSLRKEHRESAKKIDLAVCMVGARMVRRSVLNMPTVKKRSGVVW